MQNCFEKWVRIIDKLGDSGEETTSMMPLKYFFNFIFLMCFECSDYPGFSISLLTHTHCSNTLVLIASTAPVSDL